MPTENDDAIPEPTPELERVLNQLGGGTRLGSGGFIAQCPAHADAKPSLSIGIGNEGQVLLHCFAGCSYQAIVDGLNMTKIEGELRVIKETYDYVDEDGDLLYQVVRMDPKGFMQRRPDGSGGWINNLQGVRRVPYQLPELLRAKPKEWIFIVEGEKDADRLENIGLLATTNSGGSNGKWPDDFTEVFREKKVVILPDNDGPGRKHAEAIAGKLHGVAKSLRVVELPDLPDKGDVSDWLDAGGTIEELLALVDAAEEWTPPTAPADPHPVPLPTVPHPECSPDAFYGLAGRIVRKIEPHTESDPVAILLQFLAMFGNIIGRGAHFKVEGDKHFGNLFVSLVGASSKARKGTSYGRVLQLFELVEENWSERKIVGGLASGEGIIYAVRDRTLGLKPGPKKSGDTKAESQLKVVDNGVQDKRLLVVESELASVLRVMSRDGNTLSTLLRNAWDRGNLQNLSKSSPLRATNAHVSIIGHITAIELNRSLAHTDLFNGFANRFLWASVRRSKLLPHGGDLDETTLELFVDELASVIAFVSKQSVVRFSQAAARRWEKVYDSLSAEHPGILGAVTSRAEAQVIRLSLLYALLDKSAEIRIAHLKAALALWQFCFDSAKHIFGDSLGNPMADRILAALRNAENGEMNRSEIAKVFKNNADAASVGNALSLLVHQGLARMEKRESGGRPTEVWIAIAPATEKPSKVKASTKKPLMIRKAKRKTG